MHYILSVALLFLLNVSKQELKLNLKEGETYNQTYTTKMDITQTINGMDQKIVSGITGSMSFQVVEMGNDDYLLKSTYTGLAMNMQTPMGTMDFSTEKSDSEADVFSKALKSMINKPFYIRMKDNGVIIEIKDLDNLFSTMVDSFEGFESLPQAQREQIISQVKQAYGEKAFKGNIEMLMAIYPNEKVDLKDSWTNSINLESGMSGEMKNTFTLKEINKEYYLIEGTSTIKTADKEAYVQVNGMPTKYLLSGQMNSTFKIDPSTNWIIEADMKQTISGNVEIKDNPNLPGGMVIPMKMETTTTVTD